jgi:hypothetical protein
MADREHEGFIDLDLAVAGSWGQSYPLLWQFLAANQYEDGESRATGTMLIFVEQGKVKLCLADRECNDVAFVTGSSVDELLKKANEGLRTQELDWRPSRRSFSKKSGI